MNIVRRRPNAYDVSWSWVEGCEHLRRLGLVRVDQRVTFCAVFNESLESNFVRPCHWHSGNLSSLPVPDTHDCHLG